MGAGRWSKTLGLNISTKLQAWLLHKDSFMQRLEEHGVEDAKIKVLEESWRAPWDWEGDLLGIQAPALIREVLIASGARHWMFARTVFPREILVGKYACLAELKTRPLGSVLFKDPELERSEFEYISLQSGPLYNKVIETGVLTDELWARRSLFTLHGKSLLLTEVFMPDMALL